LKSPKSGAEVLECRLTIDRDVPKGYNFYII